MRTTHIVVTDDLDGSEGAETVSFAYQGVEYTIDLAEKNQAKLQKALTPYLQAGSRVAGRKKTAGVSSAPRRNDLSAVREWARENGHQVSERGRISAEVLDAYHAG